MVLENVKEMWTEVIVLLVRVWLLHLSWVVAACLLHPSLHPTLYLALFFPGPISPHLHERPSFHEIVLR